MRPGKPGWGSIWQDEEINRMQSLLQSTTVQFFLHSFVSLFVIVNAIGNIPIFVTLLERFADSEKRLIMKRATTIAALLLLVVTVTGQLLFRLFGIDMYSFRIAGGILLLIIATEMLLGRETKTQSSEGEAKCSSEMEDITVIPLAIPLLTGPGALTTGIVLFDTAESFVYKMILIGNIVLVFIISYVILTKARTILAFLGKTGTKVAARIMGIVLLSIAVQFIIKGIFDAFHLYRP
ncbi:MAG: hypothetical protein A4E62_01296 [Syntrophorhabdus sp. PtaU1.Bin002]|nr:MAG: hypothetical protein A4E58_01939 [Syntrophorhabdus sp. PtaB.Bin006]OPY71377.1 MAG: hypothetical protein A4E62_01296 [Syntrophorhabdus sp. PtaU1.Bin002]